MSAVLGIDAAWTEKQPSGLALAVSEGPRWRIASVSSSYSTFGLPPSPGRPRGSFPDVPRLLKDAYRIAGCTVDLVAVDMPLSHQAITGRRVSDQAVSLAYGGRWAGTHNPNTERPGRIGERLAEDFRAADYPLLTERISPPGIIEVYPHPALVELANSERRLPYKVGKVRDYWPDAAPPERKLRIMEVWRLIVELLDGELDGVKEALPLPSPTARGFELKAFEDTLDAVICAWIGVAALQGMATPFGDEASAIWIPKPRR